MSHSLITANRNTHVKIVVVALVAATLVATIGIGIHLSASGIELAGVPPKKAGVVKANKPVVWTEYGETSVR